MAPSIIYSIGTLVEVDNAKTGYIIEIDNTDVHNVQFKINYIVGSESEQGVRQSRCRPVNLRGPFESPQPPITPTHQMQIIQR